MLKKSDMSHLEHPQASGNDEALERRLRNQATMIGVVAHDLRLPLFRLAMAAELATSAEEDREAVMRNLASIRSALDVMTRLIDDLDDYGSLQAGQLRLVRRLVAPAAIVHSALIAFGPVAVARQIELSERIGSDVPTIFADSDRLLQVVSNLLTNALLMTPARGTIVIEVAAEGDLARFAVSDSGPGISPSEAPHLFDRYWRGSHGKYAGRGLGLAIARDLVEGHGGKIWAESERTLGACFAFTIGTASAHAESLGSL
jgi:signal transduction histidine kinase